MEEHEDALSVVHHQLKVVQDQMQAMQSKNAAAADNAESDADCTEDHERPVNPDLAANLVRTVPRTRKTDAHHAAYNVQVC